MDSAPDKLRVLIVDDDNAAQRMLSRLLEKSGFQVEQTGDGAAALEKIQQVCPHFLITDWEMPGLDGLELCRRIRGLSLPQYIYTLIVTARSDADDMILALGAGADDFVTKPIHRTELLARMTAGKRVIELQKRLSDLANRDMLTGLATKGIFRVELDKEWTRASRHHLPLSCAILDLDFFKRINDTYGHPAGDQVLRAVGAAFAKCCRKSDIVCRYGGEEFCALLPETDEGQATIWANRVRQFIGGLEFTSGADRFRITASCGVAQNCEAIETAEELVDHADQALLVAKQSGRDRSVRFSSLDDDADPEHRGPTPATDPFHGALASHVMTSIVAPLKSSETVLQAARFFVFSRVTSAPVVDDHGKLVGIASEKDLLNDMLTRRCWSRPIHEVMKTNVVTYEEKVPVRTVYNFLCRVSIRQVVIVRDGAPVGLISRGTLVRWYSHWLDATGESAPSSKRPGAKVAVDSARASIAKIAVQLSRLAGQFDAGLAEAVENGPVPYIVGGASQMQELINDLLAFSKFADDANFLAAGPLDIDFPMGDESWSPISVAAPAGQFEVTDGRK